MQVGQPYGGAGFGPGPPEGRPPQPATLRTDEHQAVVSRLGEPLQVPAQLGRDLPDDDRQEFPLVCVQFLALFWRGVEVLVPRVRVQGGP
jgi:hypothetical protein